MSSVNHNKHGGSVGTEQEVNETESRRIREKLNNRSRVKMAVVFASFIGGNLLVKQREIRIVVISDASAEWQRELEEEEVFELGVVELAWFQMVKVWHPVYVWMWRIIEIETMLKYIIWELGCLNILDPRYCCSLYGFLNFLLEFAKY